MINRTALLFGCAILSCCLGGERNRDENGATASPRARQVLLVAWDGADWRLMRPLLERGQLPNVARLMDSGSSGELRTLRPTLSPIVWTSVVTGVGPETHGIDGFLTTGAVRSDSSAVDARRRDQLSALGYIESDDPRRFYESSDRRVPALWNWLDSDAIGWWVSYPAEDVPGRLVSDRMFFSRFQMEAERQGLAWGRGGKLTHPPGLSAELEPLLATAADVPDDVLAKFVSGELRLRSGALPMRDQPLDELRSTLAKDESVLRISVGWLAQRPERALFLVYFQGVDIASHYFWKYRFAEEWAWVFPGEGPSKDELLRFGGVIDGYYRHLDAGLGRLLERIDPATTAVVLCSDHGFTLGKRPDAPTISGVHRDAAPPGILVMSGAGVRAGTIEGADVLDIAPTILTLLGRQPPDHMEGKVLTDALEP